MVRKATKEDLAAVTQIYDAVLRKEEQGDYVIGWTRGIYPTEDTAREALENGSLYVLERENVVVASARIDQEQPEAYGEIHWRRPLPPDQVLVLHTLTVDPAFARQGCAREFMAFYEELGRRMGCRGLRIDTNRKNTVQQLYLRLGYEIRGCVLCEFNQMRSIELLCLEKSLTEG